jgi:hypothetical protein
MKKGEITTSQLMYIVLGLITLGVIIYFLYQNISSSQINCQRCAAEMTNWCAKCYMGDWVSDVGKSDYLVKCIDSGECFSGPGNCGAAKSFCKAYIPSI